MAKKACKCNKCERLPQAREVAQGTFLVADLVLRGIHEDATIELMRELRNWIMTNWTPTTRINHGYWRKGTAWHLSGTWLWTVSRLPESLFSTF